MKKVFIGLGIIIVSLLITFGVFYTMSWYSFSTLPTKVVLYRMIFFFIVVLVTLIVITILIKKMKNKKFDKQMLGLICSIVQIIISIICLIYTIATNENYIIWIVMLCSGFCILSSNNSLKKY